MDMFVRAFEMFHDGNEYFKDYIQPYLDKKMYKEASQCIAKLGLQQYYDMRDICVPLILQDKINLVENYVKNNREAQANLMMLLDWLVDDETDIQDVIQ